MEDLILHPDIADPVMTLSDRDMGTLFKALMLYRIWKQTREKNTAGNSRKEGNSEADQRKIQRKARKRNKTHFFELFVNIGIDTYLLRVILNS